MKTKSIIVLIALLAFNIQSCDNYLKEKLVSDVSGAQYYTTAAGLEDAVRATYQYMKYIYSNERAYTLTVFGTDTYTNGADGNFKNFNYYDAGLRADQSILQEMWQWCYRGVNQANAVLGRSEGVTDLNAATKIQRQAGGSTRTTACEARLDWSRNPTSRPAGCAALAAVLAQSH